jgi:hypothetical protein
MLQDQGGAGRALVWSGDQLRTDGARTRRVSGADPEAGGGAAGAEK